MDMDQSAVFLAGTILTMLGFVVLVAGVIVINNMLHKYWKPVQIFKWAEHTPVRFAEPGEIAEQPKPAAK